MGFDNRLVASLSDLVMLKERVRFLTLGVNYKPQGAMSGQHRSKIRGMGLDFEELRPYQRGDSVRQIDWKVTQRTGKPYIRVYSEETDRPVILGVDLRKSMFFGSEVYTKSVVAAQIAACVAWLSKAKGDRVGLSLVSDTIKIVRPTRTEASLIQQLELISTETERLYNKDILSNVSDSKWLGSCMSSQPPQSSFYLITDGSSFTQEDIDNIERFSIKTNFSVFLIEDRFDIDLKLAQGLVVSDGKKQLELNKEIVNTPKYQQDFVKMSDKIKDLCLRNNLPFGIINTKDDPVDQITQLLVGG